MPPEKNQKQTKKQTKQTNKQHPQIPPPKYNDLDFFFLNEYVF